MKRWLRIALLVVLLGVWLSAKAIAPIILARGVQLILANETAVALPTATAAGVSAAWTGVITTLGAAVAYFAFKDGGGVNDVRVPVSGSTGTSLPPPSAAPTAGAPSSMYQAQIQSCVGWGNTPSEACDAAMGALNSNHNACAPAYPNSYFPVSGSGCSQWARADGGTLGINATGNTGCPMGYTNVNGTCTLQDARMAVKDNHCDYNRSGTSYSQANDVDCGGQVQGTTSSGVINIAGRDDLGNPVNYTVTGNSTGTLLTQQVQAKDAAGNTIVTTKQLQLNNAGEVMTNTQYSQMGNIQSGTDGVQQAGSVNLTTATGLVSPATESGASGGTIEFPTDYARENTVQAANVKLDQLHADLTTETTAPGDPTVRTASEIQGVFFPSTFTVLKAWALPAHTSECPTLTISPFDWGPFTMDFHCQLITDHFSEISPVMLLIWTLMAMFIILGA